MSHPWMRPRLWTQRRSSTNWPRICLARKTHCGSGRFWLLELRGRSCGSVVDGGQAFDPSAEGPATDGNRGGRGSVVALACAGDSSAVSP